MPLIELTPTQRRAHRADAHYLSPVVLVGANGLTPAVQKEVDVALAAHSLIKVKVANDDRAKRQAMLEQLAHALNAAPVQHIGKLLVLWRPATAKVKLPDDSRKPAPRDVKVLKFSKRPGQRPEVKQLRILGNQRLTAGGQVKRARTRAASVKKNP